MSSTQEWPTPAATDANAPPPVTRTGAVLGDSGARARSLSGPELAAAFAKHLGRPVAFHDMPFDDYRALGFPGADDMGNMYQWQAIEGEEFLGLRSVDTARALSPELLTFDAWLTVNAARIRRVALPH